ncbi:MAG: hypothetical protein V3G42_07025 [Oscillospiraceae bacterium]
MKEQHFEIRAIIFAVVVPVCILVLTGILEIFLDDTRYLWDFVWDFEIVVCIAWFVSKILHEKKIPDEKVKIYRIVWIVATILTDFFLYHIVVWYIGEWYSELTGDNGFLAGIHWIVFYGTVLVTQILWLIVRGIVAIVKAIRRKNEVSQ